MYYERLYIKKVKEPSEKMGKASFIVQELWTSWYFISKTPSFFHDILFQTPSFYCKAAS